MGTIILLLWALVATYYALRNAKRYKDCNDAIYDNEIRKVVRRMREIDEKNKIDN
jgi:hypothetical protein